jgi:hypothetical protein
MSRPRRINPKLVAKARAVAARATDINDLRAAQAVLLPALAHSTLEETATLLGVGRATVPRLQQRFREGKIPRPRQTCGGWRRALMTLEENGLPGTVGGASPRSRGVGHRPLRAALAGNSGGRSPPRLCTGCWRHGGGAWPRTPGTLHDPVAQAAWKNSGHAGNPADLATVGRRRCV